MQKSNVKKSIQDNSIKKLVFPIGILIVIVVNTFNFSLLKVLQTKIHCTQINPIHPFNASVAGGLIYSSALILMSGLLVYIFWNEFAHVFPSLKKLIFSSFATSALDSTDANKHKYSWLLIPIVLFLVWFIQYGYNEGSRRIDRVTNTEIDPYTYNKKCVSAKNISGQSQ